MLTDQQEEAILLGLLASSCLAMHEEHKTSMKQRRRQRRWWVRPSLQEREKLGHANQLLPLLRDRDVEYYREYIRMPPRTFDTLLHLLRPHIQKKDTNFRKAISAEHRLVQTLRFLAAGETLRSSSFNFLDGRSTACEIVSSVCQALWDVLGPVYVARPSSASEWLQIAREFEERWNMPHCVGAIDGKHVAIECPAKSGSEDYNYKSFFSKSMLAVCDACYRFLYVEVGHHGSDSDGGVFGQSKLHEIILSKNEGFPPDAPLGNIGQIPFYLVGDEAFPLKTYLMRPYPRKSLQPFFATSAEEEASQGERQDSEPVSFEEAHSKRIFNYRLSRARRVVENAFGIMAQRWRILRRPFKAKDDNIRRIISACVVLHNFMMKESETSRYAYCPPGTADHVDWQGNITEGSWRADGTSSDALPPLAKTGCHATRIAYKVRDLLAKHFITIGKVPWQERKIMDKSLCSGVAQGGDSTVSDGSSKTTAT